MSGWVGFSRASLNIFFISNIEKGINGQTLLEQNVSTLRELGMESLGDRINLLHGILALKESYMNGPPPSSPLDPDDDKDPLVIHRKQNPPSNVPSQDSGFAEEEESTSPRERSKSNASNTWSYYHPKNDREKRARKTVSYFTLSDYFDDGASAKVEHESSGDEHEEGHDQLDLPSITPEPVSPMFVESDDAKMVVRNAPGGMVGEPTSPLQEKTKDKSDEARM